MKKLNNEVYTVSQSAPTVFWYKFNEKNNKAETLTIELSLCESDPNYQKSLPNLWYKGGYTDRILETYWSVNTYVKDSEGNCYGMYNPQLRADKPCTINFDWMMEATEENKEKLINEVYRLFTSVTGKSATEEKIERVKDFARNNSIEVVTEIPEGFIKVNYVTDPAGSVSVCNTRFSLKAIKEGTFVRKLLLV